MASLRDSFIGRRRELAQLHQLVGSGQRLITVLGPAGMGKTRLVLEFLRERGAAAAARSVSARFCDLSEIRDLQGMTAALAQTLNLRMPEDLDPETQAQRLGELLAQRGREIVVLDNFEQLVDSCAHALDALLAAAPELCVVVTSRERLRLAGERVLELLPLSLPGRDGDAMAAESVLLFVDRARALRPEFGVQASEQHGLVELVSKLDGIPLAIELAAARVDVLGVAELNAGLPENLDLLGAARRDVNARHATMRDALRWSWNALDASEQHALLQLATFRGGISVEAAQGVLAAEIPAQEALELVQALRGKSILHASPVESDSPRLDLYQCVREFVLDRLRESGDEDELKRRHAAYFAAQARARAYEYEHSSSASALAWLRVERHNLEAAWHELARRWACDMGDAAALLEVALSMEAVLTTHGPVERLSAMLTHCLQRAPGEALPTVLRIQALRARGRAFRLRARYAEAYADFFAALALTSHGPFQALSASLRVELGLLCHGERKLDEARGHYETALAAYRALGDLSQQGRLMGNLAAIMHDERRFAEAESSYQQALELFRMLDERRLEGIFSTNLAILVHEQQRFEEGRRLYKQALRAMEQVADRRLIGITRSNLGMLEHELGNFEAARALHLEALVELTEFGDTHSRALCLARLGAACAALGQTEEAKERLRDAERVLGPHGAPLDLAAVRLAHGFVDLAESPRSPLAPQRVRERIARVREPVASDRPSTLELSDDARWMVRLLERQLSDAEPLQQWLDLCGPDVLAVGPDVSWFRAPGGSIQDLRKHAVARRTLSALLEAAEGQPRWLSGEQLTTHVWPDERIQPAAMVNRLRVALADLRKRGLKSWLQHGPEGYLLAPTLRIQRVQLGLP